MNKIDSVKKVQFTKEVANQEFQDLTLGFDKESKLISADIFARANNSFIYVLPRTCFPKANIEYIPKGVELCFLRIICGTFERLSAECKKCLKTRAYKPSKVKNQFCDIRNILADEARRPKTKSIFSTSCNLIIQYNPTLPNAKTILKNIYL